MILTSQEIDAAWPAPPGTNSMLTYARAIEQAILSKLSQGAEMPEPRWGQGRYLGSAMHRDAYTAEQMQAYGAACRAKALDDAAGCFDATPGCEMFGDASSSVRRRCRPSGD